MSPAHFARAFKQAFGLPPHRYLLTRRIERASALLRETALPVSDIGWSGRATFGRVFREITGGIRDHCPLYLVSELAGALQAHFQGGCARFLRYLYLLHRSFLSQESFQCGRHAGSSLH